MKCVVLCSCLVLLLVLLRGSLADRDCGCHDDEHDDKSNDKSGSDSEHDEEPTDEGSCIPDASEDKYIGCYSDSFVNSFGPNWLQLNGPQTCKNLCAGYKYYGLTFSYVCHCSNMPPTTQAAESNCFLPCPAAGGQVCGGYGESGFGYMTVYKVEQHLPNCKC